MKPLVYGHRGSPLKAPENTITSIKKAIEDGCGAVEIDVRKSRDNEIIVIHDAKVDKTTNGKGFVKDFTLKELKKLDCGNGEKIPTLSEVVDFVGKRIKLIIELKEGNLEEEVSKVIEKNDVFDIAIVISFYHRLIKNIKGINKKINTGLLLVGSPINVARLAQEAEADYIFPGHKYACKEMIDEARENNLGVFVWNIDNLEDLEEMLELKVDGIGSNKPHMLLDYFKVNK